MSDVGAHLLDEVFPAVPILHWVCSLPWPIRYAMGYDRRLCGDVLSVLDRHGRGLEGLEDAPDALGEEQPALASCYRASVSDVQLLGDAPGARTDKVRRPVLVREAGAPGALGVVHGVNVHAKVAFDGRDRKRLERMCRYLMRPPLAQDRLTLQADGRVNYAFKSACKDGTHAVVLSPLDFLARLCAWVPPPHFHMLRYHGVLAANAGARAEVVPGRAAKAGDQLAVVEPTEGGPQATPPPSRDPWAWLLRRVFD